MAEDNVQVLVGGDYEAAVPMAPFSPAVCDFLDALSRRIRTDAEARRFSDVATLGFWCRSAHIQQMKARFSSDGLFLGRGMAFHIAPANVPVNFMFSLIFGLLSGNANIVRVSSRPYEQVACLCRLLNEFLEMPQFEKLKPMITVVSYDHNQAVNDRFSAMSDCRLIWGGDATVEVIRQSPMKAKSVEVVFADRYSLALFDSESVHTLSDAALEQMASGFYNDTYLMDQNACSTPHLILWTGEKCAEAKARFWDAVAKVAAKYDLTPIKAVDKYTLLCEFAMEGGAITEVKRWDNRLYTVQVDVLPDKLSRLRGQFGLFYQYDCTDLEAVAPLLTEEIQTLIVHGVDRDAVARWVVDHRLKGVDRIAAVGEALDIDVLWDGYDVIRTLCRQIVF